MAKVEAVNEAFRRTQFPEMLREKNLQKKKKIVWTPPPQGWLKINVDAATDTKGQCFGLGTIIRNSTRKCITVAIKTSKFKGDVAYVEVEAAEWGIHIAKEAGMQSVILDTYSQVVADLINNS